MIKTGILVLIISILTMSFSPLISKGDVLKVDVANSTIKWTGYKPTGSHTGTISLQSGELKMEEGKLSGGSFIAEMSTIKDSDGSAKLEGHLKSEDFFDVATYATAKFEITRTEINDGKTLVTGNMTIKGITKQIAFPAVISENGDSVVLTSETFQINRTDFNVKYKSKSFFNDLKEKFINDKFDLQVTIVASK